MRGNGIAVSIFIDSLEPHLSTGFLEEWLVSPTSDWFRPYEAMDEHIPQEVVALVNTPL